MNSDRQFITITYSTSYLARMAKAILDEHEIHCVIDGDEVADAFAGYGSAVCKVNLLVDFSASERAYELLSEYEERLRPVPRDQWADLANGWVCESCSEVNEINFEQCWGCSSIRPENPELAPLPDGIPDEQLNLTQEAIQEVTSSEDDSPFRPPSSGVSAAAKVNAELNERIVRATIFGVIFPPAAAFGVVLAVQSIAAGAGSVKIWGALFANAMACLVYGSLFLISFR